MRIRYHFNSSSNRSNRNSSESIHRRRRSSEAVTAASTANNHTAMNEVHFYLRPTPLSSSSDNDDEDRENSSDINEDSEPEDLLEEVLEGGLIGPQEQLAHSRHRRQQRRQQTNSTMRSARRHARRQRRISSNGTQQLNNVTSYFTFSESDPLVVSREDTHNLTASADSMPHGTDTNTTTAANASTNNDINNTNNDDDNDEEWDAILNTEDITQLTTRLRCLFALLTCPIVPLAATLTLLLLWVLYSALLLDWGQPCDQPLRAYALLSAIMFAYTPHHRTVKRILFGYWRERDGPIRPWSVRVYDQAYHATCLLWMYAGISWTTHAQTCQTTSPHLYRSTKVFVLVQTTFMSILVVPLLCLPCIYLWLVRQASVISANRRRSRRRKRVAPEKIMASFVSMDATKDEIRQLMLGKECCICMSDFVEDLHSNPLQPSSISTEIVAAASSAADAVNSNVPGVIQTQCGHLFHRACIATWLNTPYSGSCKCPLCREDLIPPGLENADEENQDTSMPATAATEGSHAGNSTEESKEEEGGRLALDSASTEQQSLLSAAGLGVDLESGMQLPRPASEAASWNRMSGNPAAMSNSTTSGLW